MIDVQLGFEEEDNHVICEGDGLEMLNDTLSIIASVYNVLYETCHHCSEFYKMALSDPKTLQEIFEAVEDSPVPPECMDEEEEYEDDPYDWEEEFEEDEYPDLVDRMVEKHYSRCSNPKDAFKGGNGLFGFDSKD